MDETAIGADLAILRLAMAEAGDLALRYFRQDCKSWHKGPGQIVTEADIAVDRLLHDRLIGARPDDGWFSEECEDDGARHRHARVWMVDPIDGTRSFAKGSDEFTISVALTVGGETVLGSIFNPAKGELFEAVKGRGATKNGEPLKPSRQRGIDNAMLVASASERRQQDWRDLVPDARFTTLGSLAYKLALIAAGRFDGLISRRSSHDWDIAAACLLLRESGAMVGDANGMPIVLNKEKARHDGLVAAGTRCLYDALAMRLRTT